MGRCSRPSVAVVSPARRPPPRPRAGAVRELRGAAAVVRRPHDRPGGPLRLGRPALRSARGAPSGRVAEAVPQSAGREAVTNGATGTNTQEAGIDEPDVAKTDGRIVVRLRGRASWSSPTSPARRPRARDLAAPAGQLRRPAAARRRPRAAHRRAPAVGRWRTAPTASPRSPAAPAPTCSTSTSPTPPTPARHAHPLVRPAALAAAVRRHGAPGHLDRAARPAVRAARPRRSASAEATRTQPRDRARLDDRALAAVGAQRGRHQPACRRLQTSLPPGDARPASPPRSGVVHPAPGRRPTVSSVAVTGAGTRGLLLGGPALRLGHRLGRPARWTVDSPSASRAARSAAPHTDVHAFAIDGDETNYVASGRIDGTGPRPLVLRRARRPPAVVAARPRSGPDDPSPRAARERQRRRRARRAGRPARAGRLRCAASASTRRSSRCAGSTTSRSWSPSARSTRSTRSTSATRRSPRRARRAEDPGLLLLPAPDRRRPAARPRHGRDHARARTSAPRRRSSTSATPRASDRLDQVDLGRTHLARRRRRPARLHLAARGCATPAVRRSHRMVSTRAESDRAGARSLVHAPASPTDG